MKEPIGIRLPDEIIKKIERLSKEEMVDRSTIIRKLVMIGYLHFIKKKAAEMYVEGKTTLSGAAKLAGITLWEMEKFMIEQGFKSDYSIEDLDRELRVLNNRMI